MHWFDIVKKCDMMKKKTDTMPNKNELTSGAYGRFVQAYGGVPHSTLAQGRSGAGEQGPFIRLG